MDATLKRCTGCGLDKPMSDYGMSNGHARPRCKSCTNEYGAAYRNTHRDAICANAKRYASKNAAKLSAYYHANAERIKAYQRDHNALPETKQKRVEYDIKHRANYPEKVAARSITNSAIRRGDLVRVPCSVCGCPKSEAHHEDYSRPLDVMWLCVKHHRQRHREIDATRDVAA